MTGAIPKYGRNFRLEQLPYTPGRAARRYVLKADATWFIRSNHNSEKWYLYLGNGNSLANPSDTLTEAMSRMLGIRHHLAALTAAIEGE